ncbi:hypothetical protein [Umezakia ovalisporum]|uniref:hypothetical protein n=1 Tax=Umezakia ovalisporum TaxID=75695 RepID=UPI0028CB942B|nr:hypothetical protein [Umezakia ovalisporum]
MQRAQIIRCPNCGGQAQRQFLTDRQLADRHCLVNQIIRTECRFCDYLMVMRCLDGSVIEAYAPGIKSSFRPSTTSDTNHEQMLVISKSTSLRSNSRHLPNPSKI